MRVFQSPGTISRTRKVCHKLLISQQFSSASLKNCFVFRAAPTGLTWSNCPVRLSRSIAGIFVQRPPSRGWSEDGQPSHSLSAADCHQVGHLSHLPGGPGSDWLQMQPWWPCAKTNLREFRFKVVDLRYKSSRVLIGCLWLVSREDFSQIGDFHQKQPVDFDRFQFGEQANELLPLESAQQ